MQEKGYEFDLRQSRVDHIRLFLVESISMAACRWSESKERISTILKNNQGD
jgi:hypothetical protein